jgi:hypothetical protein
VQLAEAFLRGAGVRDVKFPNGMTPELAEIIGRIMRESVQGTLDLLSARSQVKVEIHSSATVIVPRDNNPLKFSPNVEVALSHLLEPKGHGFMTPIRAMRDAYDDLRAHQIAVLAGMRAAPDRRPAALQTRASGDQAQAAIDAGQSAADQPQGQAVGPVHRAVPRDFGRSRGGLPRRVRQGVFGRAYDAQLASCARTIPIRRAGEEDACADLSAVQIGRPRYNEDACGYWQIGPVGCWVVCDGAGGHEGGAVASKVAVATIARRSRTLRSSAPPA